MANIKFVEMNLNFKSKEDMENGISILDRFFTYDYIGEERYEINSLNFKLKTSAYRNEDEYGYDDYISVISIRDWYKIRTNPKFLYTDDEEVISNEKIRFLKSYRKYLIFIKIFKLLDTFTLKLYDDMMNYNIDFTENDLDSQHSL